MDDASKNVPSMEYIAGMEHALEIVPSCAFDSIVDNYTGIEAFDKAYNDVAYCVMADIYTGIKSAIGEAKAKAAKE